ncbi:MAG TPA: transglutaminase domain-containing protein [Anaerolineae bacterium]|nr:transglutaminase domain-containing protein [Anaerolineae bacterium]
MTRCKRTCLTVAIVLGLLRCRTVTPTEIQPSASPTLASPFPLPPTLPPSPTSTQTATPTVEPTPVAVSVHYQTAFGIDYTDPEQYLEQGEQSQISDPTVLDSVRTQEQSMAHLGRIYRWLHSEFTHNSDGGRSIGAVTVDQLLVERQLGGCHDYALVYAAVVRHLGYPAVMADSYSIAWIEQFQAGEQDGYVGHVFVEVHLAGKWVLVDPTNGWYVEDGYDPADPVIPLKGRIAGSSDEIYGYYVDRKGIDTWAYGITSCSELTQAMEELAGQLDLEAIVYPEYEFEHYRR